MSPDYYVESVLITNVSAALLFVVLIVHTCRENYILWVWERVGCNFRPSDSLFSLLIKFVRKSLRLFYASASRGQCEYRHVQYHILSV